MSGTSPRASRFTSAISGDAIRFGDGIFIAPSLGKDSGEPMSTYTAFFRAGARADLPAPYVEIWVILTGVIRVGAGSDTVTVRTGEFVHVPAQTPGLVEAIEDTTMVCVSVPPH